MELIIKPSMYVINGFIKSETYIYTLKLHSL